MSQTEQTAYDSGETAHQHSKDAQLEAKFGLSWREFEMDAKLSAVGTAVSEGAEKLEAFMQKVLELTKAVAAAAVSLFVIAVIRLIVKSKL